MNVAQPLFRRTPFARVAAAACALAACVLMGGGHWAALQTFAWVRMSVDYTVATGSVREGLTRTFDGEHPCELCRQVKVGLEKDRREESQKPGKETQAGKIKFAAVLPTTPRVWFSPVATNVIGSSRLFVGRSCDAPPTPPPRVAS